MRFVCLSSGLLMVVACFACLASAGDGAHAAAFSPAVAVNPATVKPVIAPHRAEYTMTLSSAKNGTRVSGVSGKLVFEWGDSCDGWTVQQNMQLHFIYADGTELDTTSEETSWESKDGKHYNFNMRHLSNGEETDNYHGRASLTGTKHEAKYTVPAKKVMVLPANAVFPSAHTQLVLQKAAAGERFFTRRVFDGSDDGGLSDVSVFIGSPVNVTAGLSVDNKLKDNPLLADKAWPVRMAFFKPDAVTDVPDYEMDLSLLPNGVANFMRIDYGDFAVTGTLHSLTLLPSGC